MMSVYMLKSGGESQLKSNLQIFFSELTLYVSNNRFHLHLGVSSYLILFDIPTNHELAWLYQLLEYRVCYPSTVLSQQLSGRQHHKLYIAHRDFVSQIPLDLLLGHPIHVSSCFQDQQLQHLRLGSQLNQGKLDSLVSG